MFGGVGVRRWVRLKRCSVVPTALWRREVDLFPAMNRWAIIMSSPRDSRKGNRVTSRELQFARKVQVPTDVFRSWDRSTKTESALLSYRPSGTLRSYDVFGNHSAPSGRERLRLGRASANILTRLSDLAIAPRWLRQVRVPALQGNLSVPRSHKK